ARSMPQTRTVASPMSRSILLSPETSPDSVYPIANAALQVFSSCSTPQTITRTKKMGWRLLSMKALRAMVKIWRSIEGPEELGEDGASAAGQKGPAATQRE